MPRHPKVTETRIPSQGAAHAADCECAEDECVARAVRLGVSVPRKGAPGPVRCEDVDVVDDAPERGASCT